MKETTMLPLGSIIILKGNTKKMMIISRVIAVPVKGNIYRFDYGACLYPEGVVGENLIYFNHEDIFKIVQEVFMSAIVRKELKLEWFLLMMEKLLQLIQLFQSRKVYRC